MSNFAVYQTSVVDDAGNVLESATVSIRDSVSGAYVSLYTDAAGTVPETNPFFADDEGFARVYVVPGKYLITISSGLFSRQLVDVLIGVSYSLISSAAIRVALTFSAGSTNNNIALDATTQYIDITYSGICTLTGMVAGYDGQEVTLSALTADDASNYLNIVPLSTSTAANQFRAAGNLYCGQYQPWTFIYSTTVGKWLLK